MRILYLDVETVGLNGPLMRIQYAVNDGPIRFLDAPYRSMYAGQELIDLMMAPDVLLVAYNASFDVFHVYRWMHENMGLGLDSPERPVKPFRCRVLDLQIPAMLKGPFRQFAFSKGKSRSVARIRRIPRKAADVVRDRVLQELRRHVPSEFQILTGTHECKGQPDLCTLSFSVDGRATLKAHARHYGAETLSLPDFWPLVPRELEKPWLPYYAPEVYAPYVDQCLKVMADPNSPFHTYCKLDIWFLRLLASELGGVEGLIDHHSDCVHAVAYTRYHGFEVDRAVLERTKEEYEKIVNKSQADLAGIDLKSSKQRLELLRSVDPLVGSSRKAILEMLARSDRPSQRIARSMLQFGAYRQRLLQVEKCLESKTGRAHPDLRVMGTATGRMAGTSGINWQGIAQAHNGIGIRAAMKCGFGGDFEALEVTIAAAAYNDQQLQADLDAGVDFHSMTASLLPAAQKLGLSYDQIVAGYKGKDSVCAGLRKTAKTVNFGIIYGAQKTKVAETIGASETEAERFLKRFFERYKGIGGYRAQAEAEFQTADTEHWQRESVRQMKAEVVDLLGFERRFDFEKRVAQTLWELGSGELRTGQNGMVVRTVEKGAQTVGNAVKSGLLGSAIAIQAAVCRQACNSPVQSAGANLTKILMARLWNELRVPIFQCHDEVLMPFGDANKIKEIQDQFLKEYRGVVKSLNIEIKPIRVWSDK